MCWPGGPRGRSRGSRARLGGQGDLPGDDGLLQQPGADVPDRAGDRSAVGGGTDGDDVLGPVPRRFVVGGLLGRGLREQVGDLARPCLVHRADHCRVAGEGHFDGRDQGVQQRPVSGRRGVRVQEVGEFEGRPAVEAALLAALVGQAGHGRQRGQGVGERRQRPPLRARAPGTPGGPRGDAGGIRGDADVGARSEVPDPAFRLVHHVLARQARPCEAGGGGGRVVAGLAGARAHEWWDGPRPCLPDVPGSGAHRVVPSLCRWAGVVVAVGSGVMTGPTPVASRGPARAVPRRRRTCLPPPPGRRACPVR